MLGGGGKGDGGGCQATGMLCFVRKVSIRCTEWVEWRSCQDFPADSLNFVGTLSSCLNPLLKFNAIIQASSLSVVQRCPKTKVRACSMTFSLWLVERLPNAVHWPRVPSYRSFMREVLTVFSPKVWRISLIVSRWVSQSFWQNFTRCGSCCYTILQLAGTWQALTKWPCYRFSRSL